MNDWSMGDREAYNREWQRVIDANDKQKRKAAKRRAYRARRRVRENAKFS